MTCIPLTLPAARLAERQPSHLVSPGRPLVLMDEGQDRIQASYRDNYQRLTEIKKEYDPGSLFRSNQNIRPAD
jgi:hypothetical protein